MPTYRDLGPSQQVTGTPDTTHRNPGNWTVVLDPQAINCKVAQAEIYQISIDGPVGSSFTVYRNTVRWNTVLQGWSNSWDPSNPLYVRPGDTLFFFWSAPVSQSPAPTVVLWMRYDRDLLENKYSE
jgi:hypothetical protein